jgi:long-chain acyl-CoA synthetase
MSLEQVQTLPQLLAWRVAATPEGEAYREFDTQQARWVVTTWAQVGERVARWRAALAADGLGAGARVAILLPNGLDTVCIDQAALALGCVPVPMHELDNPGSIAYILGDSDAELLIVSRAEQWEALRGTGGEWPSLRRVVLRRGDPTDADDPRVLTLDAWLRRGEQSPAGGAPVAQPGPDDLAAIVYTSGTTGRPKGVMLTHRNVVANVKATLVRVQALPSDRFLSFLPLSHTLERTAGYYLPMAAGASVAFARSVAQLADDLRTQQPTVLISVPRIYERIYGRIQQALAGSSLRRGLFDRAVTVGWRRFRRAQGLALDAADARVPAWRDALAWPWLERLVARPLLAQFGGRLRVAVSGGAPLSEAMARCYLGLGLPILQGYGLTETSPVAAVNALDDNDPATVGRPLPGVEIRLGEQAEIQIRGPSVMRGYWKRPEDTAKVLSDDGWFATGDQGAFDAHGRLRIQGRIKEIIVTSTGEKVSPADLELAILADSLFAQAWVVGEQRPFIAAFVVLDREAWAALALRAGWIAAEAQAGDETVLARTEVREALLARIRSATAHFPHYAQPRAVWPTLAPWTPENTLLTPTLKLKRNNLAAHFQHAIETIYRR